MSSKVISSSKSTTTAAADAIPPQQMRPNQKNQLEGIASTDVLHALLQKAMDILPLLSVVNDDRLNQDDETKLKGVCENHLKIKDHDNINALLDQMVALSRTTHLPSMEDAVSILLQQQQKQTPHDQNSKSKSSHITIPVLRAMATIFDYYDKEQGNTFLSSEFDAALAQHSTSLFYTRSLPKEDSIGDDHSIDSIIKNSPHLTKEQRKFQVRMRQLRLQNEERKYMKITQNVHKIKINDDTITTRSMTYAASIGLNMIVAPITFGVFMYFFAGSLFDYFWPVAVSSTTTTAHHHYHPATTVDVKKVIAGVISGVIMLFIEMILFVIRTHEMDKAMLQKRKKQGHISSLSPFGYYKSTTTKTYVDH